jgi:hypothetical protein
VYLRSIAIPELDVSLKGPFRPLATEQKVTLVVVISQSARPGEITRTLVDRLKVLPVPSTMAGLRPDLRTATAEAPARLFSDVQALSETSATDAYWYIDRTHADPQTGALAPLQEERRYPTVAVTIACTLKAQEAP